VKGFKGRPGKRTAGLQEEFLGGKGSSRRVSFLRDSWVCKGRKPKEESAGAGLGKNQGDKKTADTGGTASFNQLLERTETRQELRGGSENGKRSAKKGRGEYEPPESSDRIVSSACFRKWSKRGTWIRTGNVEGGASATKSQYRSKSIKSRVAQYKKGCIDKTCSNSSRRAESYK